jgi:peptidyl-tRNA hydrolase, PTH1 family
MFIVGLGNPGREYEWTRHNLGFMLIDKLAREAGLTVNRPECRALTRPALIEGDEVILVKPQTFMNLSGEAVDCLAAKYGQPANGKDLLVICDDLALPFGKLRIRERGSGGGHNGLKSIIGTIGTNEFIRLRLGIQPEHEIANARQFVLDTFPAAAREEVEQMLSRGVEALRAVIRDGPLKAMSLYN